MGFPVDDSGRVRPGGGGIGFPVDDTGPPARPIPAGGVEGRAVPGAAPPGPAWVDADEFGGVRDAGGDDAGADAADAVEAGAVEAAGEEAGEGATEDGDGPERSDVGWALRSPTPVGFICWPSPLDADPGDGAVAGRFDGAGLDVGPEAGVGPV